MRKIKAFGCMVLVIASVMVFSLAGVTEVASAYSKEDYEFINWADDIVDTLQDDVNKLKLDVNSGDKDQFFADGVVAGHHLNTSINKWFSFKNLSSETEEIRKNLGSGYIFLDHSLNEIGRAIVTAEAGFTGAKEASEEDLEKGILDLNNADSTLKECKVSIEKWKESNMSPFTPSYEAIFAIGGLLAVAYLVLRRRGIKNE